MSVKLLDGDPFDAQLLANVHPASWRNPTPSGRYNLVVIGAGSAGLITSLVASSLGAKVALVERHLMGGDCLNAGCVPSKTLLRSARLASEARGALAIGLRLQDESTPSFAAAMQRVREVRARISSDDSAARYTSEFGVDVYLGNARFKSSECVDVDGTELRFAKAVIATGGRPVAPPIPGLAETGFLDNESVFALTERPRRLAVIGAGPIGCELAQAFARLGTQVVLLEAAPQILIREDRDAAAIVQRSLVRDGVELRLAAKIERVSARDGEKWIRLGAAADAGSPSEISVDEILVAAGRAPNVEGLGLEHVGVEATPKGIRIDDFLRTTNPHIFAAGDCCLPWQFTHAADATAKLVVQNALFSFGRLGRKRLSSLVMPWCTYTDPEVAHVGLSDRAARERGLEVDLYQVPMERSNRAVCDGEDEGFVKLFVKRGGDRLVGATIVASHAGELITQATLAITQKIGLGSFTSVIYPYPTQGEALKAAAGQYTRTRLTPTAKRAFSALMRLRR